MGLDELDIKLLAPELILAGFGSLVIVVDLFLTPRSKRANLYLALLGMVVAAAAVLPQVGRNTTSFGGTLVVDDFALFFKAAFLLAAALVALSAQSFLERHPGGEGEFYGLLLFSTTGMMLMAGTRELISIYVALELTSISLYLLAGAARRDQKSSEAALKYLLLGALSSAVLLYGMALLYGLSGTTDLSGIAQAVGSGRSPALLLGMSLVAAGFGFKIAAVPFQMWAPDVYEGAPTPVTAFLSVASKAAGFVVLIRVFNVALPGLSPDWVVLFGTLSALTMTLGNVVALTQTNIKRMLAYSSIGHAGYLLMGVAAASASGLSSLMFYMLAYTFTNVAAFTVVILASKAIPDDRIGGYAGLHKRSPLLAFAMAASLLSLAGLPPMVGFFAKFYLFAAAYQAGLVWLVVLGLLTSAVSLYYYSMVIRQMYLAAPSEEAPVRFSVPAGVSLTLSVAAVFALGILSGPVVGFAQVAVAGMVR
ncbi:MAG TPA: NADH-quinone oxidoreductase subunit N [Chloroflexota bacterium]|nr:NADH-quinone oxidoreductase subunit N [Chloroflexota bacterium]